MDAVIEGSVLREGDQVRISVQLIHGATDKHLWADNYQREFRSILALQSEVARAITQQIKITLTSQEQARLASARPVNPEAYELYLKGRYYWNKRTEEGLKGAIAYFGAAIEKDPNNALAYAGLADSYMALVSYDFLSYKEALPERKAAVMKALEIDDSLAEAHASYANLLASEWDWLAAEREYKRALELNPGYATAHQWYSLHLRERGRLDGAIAEMKRARELDPLSVPINNALGGTLYYARHYDEAIDQLRKTLEMDPSFIWPHGLLGEIYVQKRMYPEAIAEFQKGIALSRSRPPGFLGGLGYAYALAGKKAEALKILSEVQEQAKQGHSSWTGPAGIFAGLGEKEQALACLEKAYTGHDAAGLAFIKADPWWDSLRPDPRFPELLRRIGLPQGESRD